MVYDRNHQLLGAQIAKDGQWRFPLIDSVPQSFIDAILLYEDKRFYSHIGVDPLAIGRAIKSNLKQKKVVSGASTLTMQTVRLSRKGKPRTIGQKIIEAIYAVHLDSKLSKDEIMRLYASHAPFGGNIVGLETASWRLFKKSPSQLSIAESAMLAVLPNAPSLIHVDRNRDRLLNKRNDLLSKMLAHQKIDTLTYELSVLEPIPEKPYPLPRLAPHALHYLQASCKGSKHVSTIDQDLQRQLTETASFYGQQYAQNNIHNVAILLLDTKSGEVLSYIGNNPKTDKEAAVDMIQARRSSGSTLKPFLHAHMLAEGNITNEMLISDVPSRISGYKPKNYDRTYRGAVPAGEALAQSLNVPAVLSLQEYKVDRFLNRLQEHGFTTIKKDADHYGLSLILGGAEVSLWELCGAFATMGRTLDRYSNESSTYNPYDIHPPLLKSKVKVKESSFEPPVISAGAIYKTFMALTQSRRPDEEGNWQYFNSKRDIAWKTGTSYGHRDAWAVGVTPAYTIGVWVGNADGEGVHGLTGVGKAAPILFDVFNKLPDHAFFETPYDDLKPIYICHHSGHLAGAHCSHIDTVLNVQEEIRPCPYHEKIHVADNHIVHNDCGLEPEPVNWFVLPPVIEHYYKKYHPEYVSLPPVHPICSQSDPSSPLEVIYPEANSHVYLPKGVDQETQPIIATATHKQAQKTLYWHLNETYLGQTDDIHSMKIDPSVGEQVLRIIDEQGNESVRLFNVVGE